MPKQLNINNICIRSRSAGIKWLIHKTYPQLGVFQELFSAHVRVDDDIGVLQRSASLVRTFSPVCCIKLSVKTYIVILYIAPRV